MQGVLFSQTLDWRLLTASLFTFLYCNCNFFPKTERSGGLYRTSFEVTLFYLLLLFMHWIRELCGGLYSVSETCGDHHFFPLYVLLINSIIKFLFRSISPAGELNSFQIDGLIEQL